jgi:hypothetical protein
MSAKSPEFHFIVRSTKHALKLRTMLHDGINMTSTMEKNGATVFEISDPDVFVELVVRRSKYSALDTSTYKTTSEVTKLQVHEPSDKDSKPAARPLQDDDHITVCYDIAANAGSSGFADAAAAYNQIMQLPKEYAPNMSMPSASTTKANQAMPKKKRSPEAKQKRNIENKREDLEAIWNTRFKELLDYKRQHGNYNVPRAWENQQLYNWIDQQRKYYKDGRLREARLRRLNDVGFSFNSPSSRWHLRYSQLMVYKKEHGHCRVPQKYEANSQLGEWVIQVSLLTLTSFGKLLVSFFSFYHISAYIGPF